MTRYIAIHHTTTRRSPAEWTVCDIANLLPMAATAARYWRDSGRNRHV